MKAEQLRLHGAARTAIIGYGIGAYALFLPQPITKQMLLIGIGLQLLVLIARKIAAAYERSGLALFVFELVVDAITVLLFALATFRGIHEYVSGV
jgi:hypothetical protein